jgi:hypothetical protein
MMKQSLKHIFSHLPAKNLQKVEVGNPDYILNAFKDLLNSGIPCAD